MCCCSGAVVSVPCVCAQGCCCCCDRGDRWLSYTDGVGLMQASHTMEPGKGNCQPVIDIEVTRRHIRPPHITENHEQSQKRRSGAHRRGKQPPLDHLRHAARNSFQCRACDRRRCLETCRYVCRISWVPVLPLTAPSSRVLCCCCSTAVRHPVPCWFPPALQYMAGQQMPGGMPFSNIGASNAW